MSSSLSECFCHRDAAGLGFPAAALTSDCDGRSVCSEGLNVEADVSR